MGDIVMYKVQLKGTRFYPKSGNIKKFVNTTTYLYNLDDYVEYLMNPNPLNNTGLCIDHDKTTNVNFGHVLYLSVDCIVSRLSDDSIGYLSITYEDEHMRNAIKKLYDEQTSGQTNPVHG